MVLTFVLTVLVLMVNWWTLATLYCLPVWVIALYENRELSLRASWKLGAATLLPGALLLTVAIFFYGLNLIDPVRLGLSFILHFVIGWVYLFISPLFLPRRVVGATRKSNPFSRAGAGTERDGRPNPES
jgi:hypothetical protein